MDDIGIFFLALFGIITLICFLGVLLSPNKRFLKMLDNKKGSTVYRVNGFGTCMYGWKVLDEEQMRFYGFQLVEQGGKWYYPIARFKTIFLAGFWIPFIPLKTQIIIDRGDGSFYPFPVEMYWKQAFTILTITYFGFFFLTTMIVLGWIGIIGLFIGTCIVLIWLILGKNKKSEGKNMLDDNRNEKADKDRKSVAEMLGVSEYEEKEILKEIHHVNADAMTDGITDLQMINKLFPNFSPKDKLKIFYYGHFVHDILYVNKGHRTF